MAKVIMPPQINSLDELLDLMVNPQKGIGYLKQLQEVRDAITEKLSSIQTVEQADDYLAQAKDTMAQAAGALKDAAVTKQQAMEFADACKRDIHDANVKVQATDATQRAKQRDLKFYEEALDDKAKMLATRADDLDIRETALTDATAALARRQAALDEEVKTISARIAAFNAVQ